MGTTRSTHGTRAEPTGRRIATWLVAAAAVVSALALGGWLLDTPALRSFGSQNAPMWPLTSIGFLLLAIGYLAGFRKNVQLAAANWSVPLAISLIALFEIVSGIDLGVDRMFFPDFIATYDQVWPGRPSLSASGVMLLLVCGGLAALLVDWRRGDTLGLAATIALSVVASVALVLIFSKAQGSPYRYAFAGSRPGAIAAGLLLVAFAVVTVERGWLYFRAATRPTARVLRRIIPLVLILPVLPSLVELFVLREQAVPALASTVFVVVGNVLIVAAVAYWAVDTLTRSQSELTQLTEALEDTSVILTDAEGRITHWSRGCEELYGWTADEARGQYRYLLLRSRCERRWRSGIPVSSGNEAQDLVETRRDGSEIAVLERVRRVAPSARGPMCIHNITDVTRGVSAMEALRASEERLALATAAHELGVVEWDVLTGALTWSPGTEIRLGAKAGSLGTFEQWRACVVPEDLQQLLDTIARAVADQAERYTYRYRFIQPNGSLRSIEGSARAFYDHEGNLQRSVGVILDNTEREEREAALRAREAQLRSVLETVPDAMVVIDEQGTIREFSAAAEAMWGYRAANMIGRNFTLLTPAEERHRYRQALQAFLDTGQTEFVGETIAGTGEAADGRRFPVEGRTGLAHVDGAMLFTIFFRDISEDLAAEERMSDLSAELAHVSRQSAMSELAADLAHELNQPLSATSNFLAAARMLIEKGDYDRVSELLHMGAEQTQRAGEIIRRLRNFMAKGEVEIRAEPVDRTVREAVDLVLVGTGQFDIRLAYSLDPEARMIYADRIQVQQVLVNLLRNAVDALRVAPRETRRIEIGSRRIDGEMVEISVRDTGPGIPEPVLKQLYTRFVTTKDAAGMGIGLSISRRIIEAHGGTLTAENRPEGGAVFRFTLPSIGEEEYA